MRDDVARASPGRRPSRPAPRGCAGRAAAASTSSSVSKNQPSSTTSSSRPSSTSRRTALKPHCASLNFARSDGVQDAVVGARDQLALGAADDPRAVREAGADREVAVAGQQRRDQRQQPAQVGREVDVHVGDDAGGLSATRRRAARGRGPSALEPQVRRRRAARSASRSAIAGVASVLALSAITIRQLNGKPSRQEAVQAADAALEPGLLVVDGDDDLDVGARGRRDAVATGSRHVDEIKHATSIGSARQSPLGRPWEDAEYRARGRRRAVLATRAGRRGDGERSPRRTTGGRSSVRAPPTASVTPAPTAPRVRDGTARTPRVSSRSRRGWRVAAHGRGLRPYRFESVSRCELFTSCNRCKSTGGNSARRPAAVSSAVPIGNRPPWRAHRRQPVIAAP